MLWARRAPGTRFFARLVHSILSLWFLSTFLFNFEALLQASLDFVLHFGRRHCSWRLCFPAGQRQGVGAASEHISRHALIDKCRLLLCLTIPAAVVAVLCFGEGDSATVGLMVLCGFVCATGVVASTGGRAYVSPDNCSVPSSQFICREVRVFVAHAVISWVTGVALFPTLCRSHYVLMTCRSLWRHSKLCIRASQLSMHHQRRICHKCVDRLLGSWSAPRCAQLHNFKINVHT